MRDQEPTSNTEPLSPDLCRLLSEAWAQTDLTSQTHGLVDIYGRAFYPKTSLAVVGVYGAANCGILWSSILSRVGFAQLATWTRVQGTLLHLVSIGLCSGHHVEASAAMLTAHLKFMAKYSTAPLGTKCIQWLEVCRS